MTQRLRIKARSLWQLLLPCLIMVVALPGAARGADLEVSCLRGCLPRGSDQTTDLLLRASESDPVTLRWLATEPPDVDDATVQLYAANPGMRDRITDRGPLQFKKSGAKWFATYELSGEELGRGTLITVLSRKKGSRESILDWRAFRLLTTAELEREQGGPPARTDWELDVRPVALRAVSGRGPLPRGRGGDPSVWWSLADAQDTLSDLDLDGEHAGIPGLGVQVAAPWPAGSDDEDPKQVLADRLKGVDGHTIRFGDMQWTERDDRLMELNRRADKARIRLRHYYTIVTLYTNASIKSFDKDEVIGWWLPFKRTFFSHETSARLKQPSDPRFWASYSEREYGNDRRMLEMLREQLEAEDGVVPGLQGVLKEDGDGGSVRYHVGFRAQVKGWSARGEAADAAPPAGFVGLDVVAARAGHGAVLTQGSAGGSAIGRALSAVLGGERAKPLDLDDPPDGFFTAAVAAQADTRTGTLSLLRTGLETAQRGDGQGFPVPEELAAEQGAPREQAPGPGHAESGSGTSTRLETLVKALETASPGKTPELSQLGFSSEALFSMSASLRAGALVEGRPNGAIQNMVPINGYVQYVVKMTVAMLPETELATTDESIKPAAKELDTVTTADVKPVLETPGWRGMSIVYTVALVAIVVLALAVPGFRQFLSGVFSWLAPRRKDGE